MEAVFGEIEIPNTAHLASDDAGSRRMCGLEPQVGVGAVVSATRRVLYAAWLEREMMISARWCSDYEN